MTALTALEPVPRVVCDGLDLLAVDAGRTEAGLVGTAQLCNGDVLHGRVVRFADPADCQAFADEGAARSNVTATNLRAGLLNLSQAVEVALRQAPPPPEDWLAFIPLAAAAQVQDFPLDVLQGWLRAFVEQLARTLQVPVDLPAVVVLGVLSAAIGGRVIVRPRDDWQEQCVLYASVFLPSGDRKSPVVRAASKPVEDWEKDQAIKAAPRIAESRAKATVIERQIEAIKGQIGKGVKDKPAIDPVTARDQLTALYEEQAALPREVVPRIIADDATSEAVIGLLVEQEGRIALLSAEGGPIDDMAGPYSDRPRLNVYLKGYTGDLLKTDRRSRISEDLPRPAVTVVVSPQLDVLTILHDIPGAAGRGLLARFLYAVPKSKVGQRDTNPASIDVIVIRNYAARLTALLDLGHRTPHEKPIELKLAPETGSALNDFLEKLEPRLGPDGDLARLAGWANKLAGQAVRLAALLHCAEHADATAQLASTAISAQTMKGAIKLARDYFLPHAQAAFGQMTTDPAVAAARRILGVLDRHTDVSMFKKSWLWERIHGQTGFDRAANLDDPLALLCEHSYIRERTPQPKTDRTRGGRPPTATYDVNPAWERQKRQERQTPATTARSEPDTDVSDVSDALSMHEEEL